MNTMTPEETARAAWDEQGAEERAAFEERRQFEDWAERRREDGEDASEEAWADELEARLASAEAWAEA